MNTIKNVSLFCGIVFSIFFVSFMVLAWVNPDYAPPLGDGIFKPINESAIGQAKVGPLDIFGVFRTKTETFLAQGNATSSVTIGSSATSSDLIVNGNISTTKPPTQGNHVVTRDYVQAASSSSGCSAFTYGWNAINSDCIFNCQCPSGWRILSHQSQNKQCTCICSICPDGTTEPSPSYETNPTALAPTLASRTASSITLDECDLVEGTSSCQYRLGSDGWQNSRIFDFLTADTQYHFTQRYIHGVGGAMPSSPAKTFQTVQTVISDGGTLTDARDGQVYPTIIVNGTRWMAQNLNYNVSGSGCSPDNPSNCESGDPYGRLYTYDQAMSACPIGWRLPSDEDWKSLELAIGMDYRAVNNTGWRGTNEGSKLSAHVLNGTNSSGFNGLLGGHRSTGGVFYSLGAYGFWWSSTPSSGNAWFRYLYSSYSTVYRNAINQGYGFSVRCLRVK
ncbi:MAG: FISUMP domain-containing protein [Candidatus Pacebacteria bacterium]|nr:FISUMP domain-containing protein [Candidatus Paceibacterota bacterium]